MKMKTSKWMMAVCVPVVLLTQSCVVRENVLEGNGPRVTVARHLKGFERIAVKGSPTVWYTQADSFSVRVEGPEDLVDNILTEVEDKTLTVRNRGKMGIVNFSLGGRSEKLVVHVTSPDLVGVEVSGSGDFRSERRVDTDRMQIQLRGSGDIDFRDIICDRCEVSLIGSGDVEVDRLESRSTDVSLVGSGDVELKQWRVDDTQLALKGSGDISVNFVEGCQRVKCQLAGSGDISLNGSVRQIDQTKSGSGSIKTGKLRVAE